MSLSLSWQDRVIIHTILTFDFDTPPPTIPYHQPSDPHKDLLKGHLHQESWSWSRTSSRVTCHCYASEEAQSSRDGFGEAQTAVLCIYTLALRIFTLLLAAFAILSCPELSKNVIVGPVGHLVHYHVGHLVHYHVGHHQCAQFFSRLIFVKRRALDVRFLDNNAGFRRAHRRARLTFLIFFVLFKFAKKVKIEQNLFFSFAGQWSGRAP